MFNLCFLQIWKKLDELYDMELVETHEYIPDEFDLQSDFFLPDGEFSELLRQKEASVFLLLFIVSW